MDVAAAMCPADIGAVLHLRGAGDQADDDYRGRATWREAAFSRYAQESSVAEILQRSGANVMRD
jgi:hypothetical protein